MAAAVHILKKISLQKMDYTLYARNINYKRNLKLFLY